MNDNVIVEIFTNIAFKAIEDGKEIRLEKGVNKSTSDILGGGLSKSHTDYDSLSLLVYNPSDNKEIEEENKEESE